MSDEHQAQQARPHDVVIAEVMDSCRAKSEHEWYAAREIERLRARIEEQHGEIGLLLKRIEELEEELTDARAEIIRMQSKMMGVDDD